ncbi:MAG: secondary thiamine-phosphate synthase enzyme YjbQ [Acidobacteria bacterium]|nr:secondary thiamine-phosphate synthase enzyme YjbQ [Acidobacteriota bacterium]
MFTLTHRLSLRTTEGIEFVNITDQLQQIVLRNGVHDGTAFVQSLHTTAAVFINEWQQALLHDFRQLLEHLAPNDIDWRHNDPRYSDCERGNATSHLRAALLGPCATVPISSGELALGTWQRVIFGDFDGPRECSVLVRVVGGSKREECHEHSSTQAGSDFRGSREEQS